MKIFNCPVEHCRMTRPLVRDTVWTNLMADLRNIGQTNNILVRKIGEDVYEVIDGNKRLGCAFSLNWPTIRCELVQ